MHKGRHYPYHPQFWVNTIFFWPGFIPWKMNFWSGIIGFPCNEVTSLATFPLVSKPGVILDVEQVRYDWPIDWTSQADLMVLFLKATTLDGLRVAEWHLQLTLLDAVQMDCYFYQSYWQTTCENNGSFWYPNPGDPVGSPNALPFIKSATYAVGGSPWTD
jgi:hypothetical protein